MPAEPTELQRWDCYIDDIDDSHIHLVMADATAGGDGREIGSFPKHLLAHLSPVEGQFVTVRVMPDERLLIENTEIGEEALARSRQDVDELLRLLEMLRGDDDMTSDKE